jgi:hypothetical protein
MYSVVINNQIFDRIPSSLQEVSIGRFIKLRNTDPYSITQVIRWAVDCDINFPSATEVEKKYGGILKLVDPVLKQIQEFMNSEEKDSMPDVLDVLGHKVKITTEFLNSIPPWSYLFSKRFMNTEATKVPFDPTDRVPEVLAHYLFSEITQTQYDETKADVLIYAINQMEMKPCIQFGSFFLRKVIALHGNAFN